MLEVSKFFVMVQLDHKFIGTETNSSGMLKILSLSRDGNSRGADED